MNKLALVGRGIQHSRSKQIYEKLLQRNISYTLLDYQNENEIPLALELLKTFEGISITAPYKNHFLDQLDENFSPINSVNTLRMKNGKVEGQNTDYLAVEEILKKLLQKNFNHIFVLGDGVMGKLTEILLKKSQTNYVTLSRRKNNFHILDHLTKDQSYFIINSCAREYVYSGPVESNILFWDMNYNLEHNSRLFAACSEQYIDGLELLELQAKYALSFWNL